MRVETKTGKEQNEKRERVASLVNWWCTRYHVSLRNYYYTQLLSNQRWRKVHQADASVFNARLISARQFHLVIAINMAATRQMYFQRCFLFRDILYPVSYIFITSNQQIFLKEWYICKVQRINVRPLLMARYVIFWCFNFDLKWERIHDILVEYLYRWQSFPSFEILIHIWLF